MGGNVLFFCVGVGVKKKKGRESSDAHLSCYGGKIWCFFLYWGWESNFFHLEIELTNGVVTRQIGLLNQKRKRKSKPNTRGWKIFPFVPMFIFFFLTSFLFSLSHFVFLFFVFVFCF